LVFIPCVGEFVIPDLLGGAQTPLIGNIITDQFLKVRNWPLGAAMAFWLVVSLAVFQVLVQPREIDR
jgi:spermidine/putrescine transport system permease protein